jgi:hypothetical protein
MLPLLDYDAKQGHDCINLSTHIWFYFTDAILKRIRYMHFSYLLLTKNLSFSLPSPFFPIAFKFHGYRCRCHPQCLVNGIHGPTGQQLNRKDGSSAGKKEKIRKFWVHVFYDFPFSTSSASSISLPSLTMSSTRIFPSVATKYR